jgi:signal transduction histidine kinase
MELHLEIFDIVAMVDSIVSTVHPLATQNGNTLEVACPPDIGRMVADELKVRQMLLNLLSNACKFTNQGTVSLTVSRETHTASTVPPVIPTQDDGLSPRNESREWIIFVVHDTGIGMSTDQLDHIFEAFTQADASTTRQYGGTGLGLAVSQRFCQMMGGTITVVSEPGCGTTFTVSLPAEVAAPQPVPATLSLK